MKLLTASILTLALSGCWGGGGSSSKDNTFTVTTTDTEVIVPDYDNETGGDPVVIKGTALISWTAPTRNDDASPENPLGTLLTNLDGFKIYYGTFPDEYTMIPIDITNIGLSSYLIEDLDAGDWFFVMTAYNTYGMESNPSIEVSKQIKSYPLTNRAIK